MAKRRKQSSSLVPAETGPDKDRLLGDLRGLIDSARDQAARALNAGLVLLYWGVGERIRREILGEQRAAYGEQIVATVSVQLTAEYGRGFSRRNVFHMIRLAEVYPDAQIVQTLSAQLGWSHFLEILPMNDPLKRDFYAEMCRLERWSVRTLRDRVRGMFYERTAIARKPAEVAKHELETLRDEDRLTPDLVFRDPYILDFLALQPPFREKDLERAILRELETFLLELGGDFAFMARQKRITVDYKDYYIDLLFYHRRLRRLVVIDLKLERFQAADKGQMELYLNWLDKYERRPGEAAPLGLILCAEKSAEHVELLRMEESGIRVAEYLTELPPRALLEKKLHEAIRLARRHLETVSEDESENHEALP
jgi:predicted nuclease of restriction endonuclease-like (RecB) superfamily